jgi:siroheme synthase-like protein
MMSASYPIQLRLQTRSVLVAGAGPVAARKLERLASCGAQIRVVASRVSAPVRALADAHQFACEERAFRDEDVLGTFLVIAATDDAQVNQHIAALARGTGALVLRVDAPEHSDFILPAWTHTEHVEATISTRGKAPAASRRLSRELAAWLAQGPERFAAEVARARLLLATRKDSSARLRDLADGALFDACRARNETQIAELMTAIVEAP